MPNFTSCLGHRRGERYRSNRRTRAPGKLSVGGREKEEALEETVAMAGTAKGIHSRSQSTLVTLRRSALFFANRAAFGRLVVI
jgi:hypothetical protein